MTRQHVEPATDQMVQTWCEGTHTGNMLSLLCSWRTLATLNVGMRGTTHVMALELSTGSQENGVPLK